MVSICHPASWLGQLLLHIGFGPLFFQVISSVALSNTFPLFSAVRIGLVERVIKTSC